MLSSVFYGWWIVLASFLISVLVGACGFFGFTAMLDPIVKEFHWSYMQVSFASSLRGLEMGLLAPFVGVFVDRFGPRKILLVGLSTIGMGFILLSLMQNLWMFYAAFILLAFGAGGCATVVTLAVVARWFQRNLGKAMGISLTGYGASGLLVPAIVWLIDSYGWRSAMVIQGIGIWILGIPLALLIRNRPEDVGQLPDGLSPTSDPSVTTASIQPKSTAAYLSFRDAVRSRPFIYLNIVEALRFMVLTAVVIHVMPHLGVAGISRETAGFVAASIPLFSIPGRFGFGWMGDVADKRYVMAISFFCMSSGLLAFCFASAMWPLLIFLLLFSPGFGGMMVMRGAVIREYFGVHSFGKLAGITMGSASIGGVIGPTLAGWIFDLYGNYSHLWMVFAVLLFLMLFISLRIHRPYL